MLQNPNLDLTEQLLKGADIIASEMRENVKDGLDVHDVPLTPNKEEYAKWKQRKFGHAKPLIAKYKKLISSSSYKITKVKMNHVKIALPDRHPDSGLTIGQIAYIHNYGLGRNPVRKFVGATKHAVERIVKYLTDYITRLLKK